MKVFPFAGRSFAGNVARASLLLIATVAATSHAQSALTREQVKAELREAIRTGDMSLGGETGQKLKQLFPGRYPKAMMAVADAGAAPHAIKDVRGNKVYANGEFGVAGQEYAAGTASGVMGEITRAQVKAQTLEAISAGEIVSGELGQSVSEGTPPHFAKRHSDVRMAAPKGMTDGAMMN